MAPTWAVPGLLVPTTVFGGSIFNESFSEEMTHKKPEDHCHGYKKD